MTTSENECSKLKPCPFCGSDPISEWVGDEDGGYWEVACNKCIPKDSSLMVNLFVGVHGHREDECIHAWNARSQDADDARRFRFLCERIDADEGWTVLEDYPSGMQRDHIQANGLREAIDAAMSK